MSEYTVKYRIGVDTGTSTDNLDRVAKSAENADNKLGKMATPGAGSGSATYALTNFNRVVQDAPYGLMGVANNIDPLMTSFQKLRAETGSTGGAFKAMLGTLSGPMGLLFGINAVVFALQVLPGLLQKISKSSLDVTKDFKGLRDATISKTLAADDDIKKLLVQKIAIESVTISLKKGALSTQDKKYWIGQLNKEYKPYIEQLEGHKVKENNLSAALNIVNKELTIKINNMITEKVIEKMREAIADKLNEIFILRTQNEALIGDYNALKKKYNLSDQDIQNAVNKQISENNAAIQYGGAPSLSGDEWISEAREIRTKLKDNLKEMDKKGLLYNKALKEVTKMTQDANYQFGQTNTDKTPKKDDTSSDTGSSSKKIEDAIDPFEKLIEESFASHIDRLNEIYLAKYQETLKKRSSPEYLGKDPLYRPDQKPKDTSLEGFDVSLDPSSSMLSSVRTYEIEGFLTRFIKGLAKAVNLTGSLRKGFDDAASSVASAATSGINLFREQNSLLEIFINSLVKATIQSLILSSINSLFGFIGGAIPFLSFLDPSGGAATSGGGRNSAVTGGISPGTISALKSISRQTVNVGGVVTFRATGRDLKSVITAEELFRATQR